MNNRIESLVSVDVVTLGELDKKGLLSLADQMVRNSHEYGLDVLAMLAEATKLELVATRIKEQAKSVALNEVLTYGRGGVSKLGVSMTTKEVGVSYDYSGDRVWKELNRTVLAATAKRKEQEEILRSLPYEGRIMMDEETGEEYRAYPPARTASDGVVLTIK
ncbi:hypothetical protein [Spirosoma sordidisoli]|uniref:Uncharacterized protein n=1 Tax=Spirosoma sordidisoli TaxID=2502893 RepID=A0A4Q2UJR1_9BACT|nr:hypothetical protein [Spirosoma sordidisoli]RYC69737.1 hypothetical protein EQG79_14170 [Spirosoma sordidisoli]